MEVALRALATANPARYVSQAEVFAFLSSHFPLSRSESELYRKLLLGSPIRGRHIGVDVDEEICTQDPDVLVQRFARQARLIARQAAQEAMAQAQLESDSINGLVVNTCTGYLCPGLSSYLVEDLHLPAHVTALDLMGMGCGGAIPNLETAGRMIQSGAKRTVLSISVEICSATFFLGPDPDLIVSNSIFADGASAAIVQSSADAGPNALRFLDFESLVQPKYRDHLRYKTEGGRLRNTLSRNVPILAAKGVGQTSDRLLKRHALSVPDVDHWIIHPGGTQILKAIEKQLGLPAQALRWSHEVFREYGNMSSPSVMFALSKALRQAHRKQGEKAVLASFGAGFTTYAALVELL